MNNFAFILLLVASLSNADIVDFPCTKDEMLKPADQPDKKIGTIGRVVVWEVQRNFKPQPPESDLHSLEDVFRCVNLEFRKNSNVKIYNLQQQGLTVPQPSVEQVKIERNLIKVWFGSNDRFAEDGDGYLAVYKYSDKNPNILKEVGGFPIRPHEEKRKSVDRKLSAVRNENELRSAIKSIAKLDKDHSTQGHSLTNKFFVRFTPTFLKQLKLIFGLKPTKKQKVRTDRIVSDYLKAIFELGTDSESNTENRRDDESQKELWKQLSQYAVHDL